MCDYSLHDVQSRPAKVGDKLVSTAFENKTTHGFAAVGKPGVAVCLLPGTELAFDKEIRTTPIFRFWPVVKHRVQVARFRQVNLDSPQSHHDALELQDGTTVLVTDLAIGQKCTVLQLPVMKDQKSASEIGRAAVAEAIGHR